MNFSLPHRIVSGTLIVLLLFGAISSLAGAVLAIGFNGAGVPLKYLSGTPFPSFLVPGLILGAIVGGTQLGAAVALLMKHRGKLMWSAIAGFGMLIWILTELAIIGYSWLQTLYFGLGAVELMLVFALLGIAPRIVALCLGRPDDARKPTKLASP